MLMRYRQGQKVVLLANQNLCLSTNKAKVTLIVNHMKSMFARHGILEQATVLSRNILCFCHIVWLHTHHKQSIISASQLRSRESCEDH